MHLISKRLTKHLIKREKRIWIDDNNNLNIGICTNIMLHSLSTIFDVIYYSHHHFVILGGGNKNID